MPDGGAGTQCSATSVNVGLWIGLVDPQPGRDTLGERGFPCAEVAVEQEDISRTQTASKALPQRQHRLPIGNENAICLHGAGIR